MDSAAQKLSFDTKTNLIRDTCDEFQIFMLSRLVTNSKISITDNSQKSWNRIKKFWEVIPHIDTNNPTKFH